MSAKKPIIFSGIKSSGDLHIANYLGAIQNWVAQQDEYQPIYQIMDYHTITGPIKSVDLAKRTWNMALDLLAIGIDPKKSIFTIQSMVPEHTELAWILGCLTPLGILERMPTYKEKKAEYEKHLNLGLLAYPVLQAADILIYKAEAVPVGEDQDPHIEFTRVLARKFNHRFGKTFPEPKTLSTKTARIMGLDRPKQKMSKSFGAQNYIALADDPYIIKYKIAKAVTDTGPTGPQKSPGVANLFLLLENFGTKEEQKYFTEAYKKGNLKYSELKETLAKSIAEHFAPFREKRAELVNKEKYVKKILMDGAVQAQKIAAKTLQEVKEKMGLRP